MKHVKMSNGYKGTTEVAYESETCENQQGKNLNYEDENETCEDERCENGKC